MIIALVGGGPRDGALVEVSDDCCSYYDFRDQDTGWWYRYVEIVIPHTDPPEYRYHGCRPDESWWHC